MNFHGEQKGRLRVFALLFILSRSVPMLNAAEGTNSPSGSNSVSTLLLGASNPNGIVSSSPGLRGTSYPGLEGTGLNPEGVPSKTQNKSISTASVPHKLKPLGEADALQILTTNLQEKFVKERGELELR